MNDIKTVDGIPSVSDPLIAKQREVVSKMRTSLIACSDVNNSGTAKHAIDQITALRIYHQLSKIIRYTEMMDKIEAKLYEALDYRLDTMDVTDEDAWMSLMRMQSALQTTMIESHKILQPYLDISSMLPEFDVVEDEGSAVTELHVLPKSSRDKIRIAAQSVLSDIQKDQAASEG